MNQKKNSSLRFVPAVKAALICLVTCALGLGYVWQKQQISKLGEEMKKREEHLGTLRQENKRYNDILAQLKSPQTLDQMAREWRLNLEAPKPQQVVVATEPATENPVRTIHAARR